MNYSVLGDRVLAKTNTSNESTTSSGLILTTPDKKCAYGTIISVGITNDIEGIKEGVEIIYGKYAGVPVVIEGIEYVLLENEEVLITINKDA